jgi:hypothetical protein
VAFISLSVSAIVNLAAKREVFLVHTVIDVGPMILMSKVADRRGELVRNR